MGEITLLLVLSFLFVFFPQFPMTFQPCPIEGKKILHNSVALENEIIRKKQAPIKRRLLIMATFFSLGHQVA